jgi:tetratricopeptide (TPR) repeat protein
MPLDSIPALDRPYFSLATVYAEIGDASRARRLMEKWESEVDPEVDDPLGTGRAMTLGFIALAEARPEEAIDLFRDADERIGGCPICRLPEIGRAYDEAGLADSAIAVYTRFFDTPWWNRVSEDRRRGPILERLGQLHDERGDLQSAAKYYAMFVELWAGADDALQPRVRAAQARLEAILGEIG